MGGSWLWTVELIYLALHAFYVVCMAWISVFLLNYMRPNIKSWKHVQELYWDQYHWIIAFEWNDERKFSKVQINAVQNVVNASFPFSKYIGCAGKHEWQTLAPPTLKHHKHTILYSNCYIWASYAYHRLMSMPMKLTESYSPFRWSCWELFWNIYHSNIAYIWMPCLRVVYDMSHVSSYAVMSVAYNATDCMNATFTSMCACIARWDSS